MEIAKSKIPGGCGRDKLSATIVECGACWRAILMRFVDLAVLLVVYSSHSIDLHPFQDFAFLYVRYESTHRSDPTINTFLFTARYFPFPHPTSAPTAPSVCSLRNRSTIGHGWIRLASLQNHRECGGSNTLYRVDEKWDAISSYTVCTCSASYCAPCGEGLAIATLRFLWREIWGWSGEEGFWRGGANEGEGMCQGGRAMVATTYYL